MQFKQTRVRLLFIFSVPRYMMSWIFLIGAMSFIAPGSLFSQATYLPQGDKSYILLDRLEIKTGKDSAFNFSKTKPFSRQHAVDAVRNLMSQGSGPALSKTDAHNLRSFYLNNLEYIPEEKAEPYEKAHAGLPLVQHSVLLMLYYYTMGKISLEKIVDKMSHAVADCFQVKERGYIREGYYADLIIVDLARPFQVEKKNILYKCGWSPLEGFEFPASITHSFVNGNLVYENSNESGNELWNPAWNESQMGQRLSFDR